MAVTIKAAPKSKKATKPKVSKAQKVYEKRLSEIADELAALDTKISPLQDKIKPLMADRKLLEEEAIELADKHYTKEEKVVLAGSNKSYELSPQPNSTEITNPDKVITELENVEEGLFKKLAKVTLTDLRAYLTPKALEGLTKTERKGKRKLKAL